MVRCGVTLLYLEMFYTERALLLKDTSSLWCPRDLFGACRLLLQIETSEKTQALDAGVFWSSLFFSPQKKKKKFIITEFIMASVTLGLAAVGGL